jgi:hypothetical protein
MSGPFSPNQGNIFDASNAALRGAGAAFGSIAAPGSMLNSMNSFANPYQTQVLDNALSRLRDDRNMQLNEVAGKATMAGAFGGSRHGVVDADLRNQANRNAGELAANINRQGFMDQGQLAAQEQYLRTGAAGGLLNTGIGMASAGRDAMADQGAAGAQQQQLLQAILSGASGAYSGFANSPNQMLEIIMASLNNPLQGQSSSTQTSRAGLLDFLSLGAGIGGAYLGSPFASRAAGRK